MAKIKLNQKELYEKLLKRTEFYAAGVRKIMQERIGEIAAMCAGLEVDDEKPFAFSDYPDISPKVQEKLRQMYSEVYQSVRGNVTREWNYSNVANDALVKGVFGRKSIESQHFARYFARNKEAMQQFFARTQQGLNLSQRVWRCVGQAKEELELALDLGLGEGKDAGQLSRDVRKYLNDPEKLFRRVRNKRGELVLSKAAKAYHPGQGVYRSSYKNAMRLTRTETNMAYRTADCTRWQQLDFVLGYEVKVSKNHPVHDICDELAGVYPKGFLFRGWHPHCYCYLVPKLCSEQELGQLQDMILEGRDTSTFAPAGIVTEPPAGYMEWVANNTERIEQAKSLPYFIRDNYKQGDISKGFSFEVQLPHKKTVWEIAEERHAQRDDDAVQTAWDERKATNKAKVVAGNVLEAADSRGFRELGIDTAELEEAIKAGKRADIELKTRELAKSMAAKQKAVRRAASNVQAAYSKYNYELLGGMDAELAELEAAVKGGKLTEINSSTRKLAKAMSAAKKQMAQQYGDLLDNPLSLFAKFGAQGVKQVYAAVEGTLNKWYGDYYFAGNNWAWIKHKLEHEIAWVESNKKYPTWKFAQDAYKKQLVIVENKLKLQPLQGDIQAALSFTSKSSKVQGLQTELNALYNATVVDEPAIKAKLAEVQKEIDRLTKERAKKYAGKSLASSVDTMESLTKEEVQALLDAYKTNLADEMDDALRPWAESVWATLTEEEKWVLTKYTQTYKYLVEPLRGLTYYGTADAKAAFANDMPLLESALAKFRTPKNMVVRRGTDSFPIGELGYSGLDELKVGDEWTDGGFLSTAVHRDKGFKQSYNLVIVVPKGAQGAYAEPFSHYNGDSLNFGGSSSDMAGSTLNKCKAGGYMNLWDGKDKWAIMNEQEWIGQRGCRFRVLKKQGKTIYMQLISQMHRQQGTTW